MSTWSLPGRALTRRKYGNADSHRGVKSSTVHGNPSRLHSRGKLSHVFSSLSEKRLNQDVIGREPSRARAGQQTPSCSVNTIMRECTPIFYFDSESPVSSPLNIGNLDGASDQPAAEETSQWNRPLLTPIPGPIGNVPYQPEKPGRPNRRPYTIGRERSSYLARLAEDREPTKSRKALEVRSRSSSPEVRSRSSSYPSEGIRSPTLSPRSPLPTQVTENLVAEYVQCGTWPIRSLQRTSDISIGHWMSAPISTDHNQAGDPAPVGCNDGLTEANWGHASLVYRPSEPAAGGNSRCSSTSEGVILLSPGVPHSPRIRDSSLGALSHNEHEARKQNQEGPEPKSSPPQAASPNIVNAHGESSNTATFGLRFSTTLDENTPGGERIRHQNSTLHNRTDTQDSGRSTFRRSLDIRRPDCLEDPLLVRDCSPTSHISIATSFSQRLHQFKLRQRVRKACGRSKARFQKAVKPLSFSITSHPSRRSKGEERIRSKLRNRVPRTDRRSANRLLAQVRKNKIRVNREQKRAAKKAQRRGHHCEAKVPDVHPTA